MTTTFALTKLFDDVTARFVDEAVAPADPVPNVFGWREPGKQRRSTHRICWVPGDDQSGELGAIGPARNPGRNPRPLATVHELATVYVEAVDTTAPEDERKQYEATRELFDAWLRAVYLAARGTYEIKSARWDHADTRLRRHGATLRVVLAIEAMVPDSASAIAPADVVAEVTPVLDAPTPNEPDANVPDTVTPET